jgi:glutamate/tyrosine decarboxylase-like PLP-dependent enzyme
MDAESLEKAIVDDKKAGLWQWLIVASAGTTNTGSVDPLMDIGDIAAKYGLWFHVDGAYGGLFVLCPEGKAVLKGIHKKASKLDRPLICPSLLTDTFPGKEMRTRLIID